MFFRNKPKARVEVHQDDERMVKPSDLEWVGKQTQDDADKMCQQDDAFRIALYMEQLDTGLSSKEAAKKVKKTFPIHYLTLAQRSKSDEGENAAIPFALKGRVLRHISRINPQTLESASSFNAFVRAQIRAGLL